MLLFLAVLLIAIGIAGTVLPALPGPMLVFAGVVLAAWSDGFARIGPWTLALAGALTAVTFFVDFVSASIGVKRVGASGRAIAGAALGALGGLFFGLPGLLVGPFVGATLGELTVRGDLRVAGRAGFAAWLGLLLGTVAKLAIVFAVVAIAAVAFFY